MPELDQGIAATRAAFLDLQEERQLVQDGYDFLDEKRILLAAELLRLLARYDEAQRDYLARHEAAVTALANAVTVHGLEGLGAYPALTDEAELRVDEYQYVGLRLHNLELTQPEARPRWKAVHASPEARQCAQAFRELTGRAAALAALAGNLRRLTREYARTERRARALENVLLPEIDRGLKTIGDQLETQDQEDVVRVRLRAGNMSSG